MLKAAANQKISFGDASIASTVSRAPMPGPRVKAMPTVAPVSPMYLARSFGGTTSAMNAWATGMLPPERPPTMRAAIKKG